MATLIINPNSTEAMTASMTRAAQRAEPTLSFEGWTSRKGPPSIQGAEDGQAASAPLLELVATATGAATGASAGASTGAEGIIIGCFDDTALDAAAQAATCPVLGIGQAAFHYCAMRQWRFGVVTTLAVSVPVIEDNLSRYGLAPFCTGVRASDVPVLALEEDPQAAIRPILDTARQSVDADGAQAVILGCAGMVSVVEALRREIDVPVIDPVEAAATGIRWLLT